MSDGTKWQEYCREVRDKGFDNASPMARLVWSCETGRGIDQHASTDLLEIMDELAALQALDKPMVCGHKARYAVNSDEGTSWCCMCELEAERWPEKIVSHE